MGDDSTRESEWSARSRSFGAVAEEYEAVRPGYPDPLYEQIFALAPGRRVLEAGAGTGRATGRLTDHGAVVTAVEPDAGMAAILRRRAQHLPITVEQGRFEDHDAAPGEADLVVSAQAWHWVDQAAGAAVAARALGEGGVLALWWNIPGALTGPAWEAVDEAYAREAPELGFRSAQGARAGAPALERAAGFGEWAERTFRWEADYDATRYTRLIGTHSDHIRLPAARRRRLLDAVGDAIDRNGRVLVYPYRTVLVWACREP